MFGHLTPRLPSRILGLPVAHQKSLAGALGSFGMGALTTLAFWGFCGDGMGIDEAIWQWGQPRTGGWLGISLLSIGAGAATSFTELLGESARCCTIAIHTHTCVHSLCKKNRYLLLR